MSACVSAAAALPDALLSAEAAVGASVLLWAPSCLEARCFHPCNCVAYFTDVCCGAGGVSFSGEAEKLECAMRTRGGTGVDGIGSSATCWFYRHLRGLGAVCTLLSVVSVRPSVVELRAFCAASAPFQSSLLVTICRVLSARFSISFGLPYARNRPK